MKDSDLAAVGTLSVDTGWKLLVNFTRDRRQLAAAIGDPGSALADATEPGPAGLRVFLARGPPRPGPRPPPIDRGGAGVPRRLRDMQTLRRKSNDELLRGRATKHVSSLAGIGRVLDSVRGTQARAVLLGGLRVAAADGELARRRFTTARTPVPLGPGPQPPPRAPATPRCPGEIWKIDNDARFGSTVLARSALRPPWRSSRDPTRSLDTVDIGGLRAEGDPAPKNEGGTDTLFTMAADTGGDFVRNANQLGGELEKVSDRTSLVYLLVYSPTELSKPGAFHALKVNVKAPGATRRGAQRLLRAAPVPGADPARADPVGGRPRHGRLGALRRSRST